MGIGIIDVLDGKKIDREDLPQIPKSALSNFVRYLLSKNIEVKCFNCSADKLFPSQSQINMDKVSDMEPSDLPLVTDKDNNIMDGHHRWATNLMSDIKYPCRIIKVMIPLEDLMNHGHNFGKSFTKSISESL